MDNVTQNDKYENIREEQQTLNSIRRFGKTYKMGKALRATNAYKTKGFAVIEISIYLLQLIFTHKSMYMNMATGTHTESYAKDVVYRFLNSPYINWCTFVLTMARNVITTAIRGLTSTDRLCAIAIDDTFYARLRSKKVELLANVFDHASKGKNTREDSEC